MPYKFCPNCFSSSYSQVDHKLWLCPTCGKDISIFASTPQVYSPIENGMGLEKPKYLRLIQGGKL